MIVIDTSAVVDVLVQSPVNTDLASRLALVTELHVPHVIDVEFLSVLRRLVSRGLLSEQQAITARKKFGALPFQRYPHHVLSDRVWQLRNNVTTYDGQYLALAEILRVPLITSDLKLARSTGHQATVESFARDV